MSIFRGLKVTALGTLLSRLLGMVRDMLTAYRFGASVVMDALVLALRAPDLFRRLLGEGVLGASLIPRLAPLLPDRERARQFMTATLLATSLAPLSVVAVGEACCGWQLWTTAGRPPEQRLVFQLTALLLPYVIIVCLLAQLAAALHTLNRFTAPALVTCVLNLAWIGACLAAPQWSAALAQQAKLLAVAVVAAGLLQVAWLAGDLISQGWRPARPSPEAWREARAALATLLPAGLAISATQVNTTIDAIAAWWLSQTQALPTGAASAIYFGERMFMLPVGVVGIATAVVVYPALCRMAEARRHAEMAEHAHQALRGIWLLAAPASVGLFMLAPPAVGMLLQRGEFQAEDSRRAGDVAAAYGLGVWAFAVLPLLARLQLALNRMSPAAVAGGLMIGLNAGLAAVWGRSEWRLAAATAALAAVHVLWLLLDLRRRIPLSARRLAPAVLRITLACGVMAAVISPWSLAWRARPEPPSPPAVLALVALGAAVHLSVERLLRRLIPDPQAPPLR